jgi:ankyrin repeat protein
MSYIALENMHYDKQRYYWNWREHIPRSLITGNERGEGAIWAASFWVRRFQEGNHEEVAAILEEIKQHYEADEELPALIDAKRIAELEEKIAHEFRNGINPTVKDYVAKGADPGLLLGIDGITDLHIAVLADDIPRVSDLLSSTDISILDQFDCSPLVYARSTGMAEFLIEKGAVINDLETRYLPIEYFIMDRNVKLVKLLIEKGANVNLKNRQLHTALHRALPSGDTLTAEERKILEIMLEAGADPRIANRHGVSPLDVAREYNKYEVVKMFEEAILKLD